MLLESADRTARLDLLEMQYYRELLKNEKYSDHMSLPETMIYSGTCRSISSRISQDNVSLSAALCCKAIKLHTSNADGKIIIWTHVSDSVEKESFMAEKWITREYNGWQVELSLSLLNEMQADRRRALPNETGGVLIGAYDIARKRVYVVCQVKAPDDSISSPTSFIRGCANLPERLDDIVPNFDQDGYGKTSVSDVHAQVRCCYDQDTQSWVEQAPSTKTLQQRIDRIAKKNPALYQSSCDVEDAYRFPLDTEERWDADRFFALALEAFPNNILEIDETENLSAWTLLLDEEDRKSAATQFDHFLYLIDILQGELPAQCAPLKAPHSLTCKLQNESTIKAGYWKMRGYKNNVIYLRA